MNRPSSLQGSLDRIAAVFNVFAGAVNGIANFNNLVINTIIRRFAGESDT